MQIISKVSDMKGRLIAYLGGTSVSAYSADLTTEAKRMAADAASQASVMAMPVLHNWTVGDVLALGGFLVVLGRFVFDVFKYFDQRSLQNRETDSDASKDT